MNLSKRCEYALRALIDLGIAAELGRPILQVSELAAKEKLPIKFLEQIFTQLKAGGYVESTRGKLGGYSLAKNPTRIKFGAIIRLIDGPLAPIRCVSQTAYSRCTCPDETHCGLRMLMWDLRNAISDILDRTTLAEIVDITLRKFRRDKVTPPFLQRSVPLMSILPRTTLKISRRGKPKPRRTNMSIKQGLLGVMVMLLPLSVTQAATDAARLEKLERAVEQLQNRNAELEQEVKSLKKQNASAETTKSKPKVASDGKSLIERSTTTEEKKPVYVVPGGPEYKLTLGGYIQMNYEGGDVSAFEGRFGANALKNRFRLRRARINLTGDFAEQFDFKIEGDFEQSDAAITASRANANGTFTTVTNSNRVEFSATDIFVNWHAYPEANVKVGQWKAPFGLEQITPDPKLFTIERSLPTSALTPERQIGLQVWGKPFTNIWPEEKELVTYYAGIFNGNGRNFNNNDNNNFMTVGRLEVLPWKGNIAGIESSLKLGGDVLHSRDDGGTNISPAGNLRVNPDGSLTAFTLPGADERVAWSLDAWLNVGPFDLIGEYFHEEVNGRNVNGVAPGFADFEPSGWYVQGSYFILPKKLQAVVKWEALNPGQFGNDGIHSITAGLNYYIHGDSIKLMANYVHTWSDFREANPTIGQDDFDEVLMRLQVMF
jgi:Rrf2 family protein